MKKVITTVLKRKNFFRKIDLLPIKSSGIDKEGDPFVQLLDGTIFFGNQIAPTRIEKPFLYKGLSKKTRKVLQFEALQVAKDIVIRYVEGALMSRGPLKQAEYTVKDGDYVAEMGAYQGFYSIKLAQQVGPKGKVVCIEPMPDNFRILKKNKEANKLNHMHIVNKGVWDISKNLEFNRRRGDGQSSSIEMKYENADKFLVPADTLDSIFLDINVVPTDFVIIQLNGAEINALRGLKSFNPKNLSIAARYDTEGVDAAIAIKKLLEKRGYETKIKEDDFVFASI